MKYKNIVLFLITLFILSAMNVFSQNSAPVLKNNDTGADEAETYKIGEITGNINRKAVYLAKPVYPREAREAGAEGAVKVQITIDEEGNVTAATAISGHPLLRSSSEQAALKTKFRKVSINGEMPKTTGVLIYNFEIEKAGWVRIGYNLAVVQKAPTLIPFNVPSVAKAFQPDWTDEKILLEKLGEFRRAEIENLPNTKVEKPVLQRSTEKRPDGTMQSSMSMQMRLPIPNPPTPERIAVAQNLIVFLQSRLASDELSLWQFNLGVNLGKALELYRNPNERINAAVILRQFADNAPSNVPAETLAELQKLIAIFEKGARTFETQNELAKALANLFKSK